jgi:hypothetical protein
MRPAVWVLSIVPDSAHLTANGASERNSYEAWAIDQFNSPGTSYAGTLYIWNGRHIENKHE